MFLQTFVQLNILLLTAPTLAGWAALPVGHPLLAQIVRVVSLSAPQAAEALPQNCPSRHGVARTLAVAERSSRVPGQVPPPAPAEPAITLFHPFPHAARAP